MHEKKLTWEGLACSAANFREFSGKVSGMQKKWLIKKSLEYITKMFDLKQFQSLAKIRGSDTVKGHNFRDSTLAEQYGGTVNQNIQNYKN